MLIATYWALSVIRSTKMDSSKPTSFFIASSLFLHWNNRSSINSENGAIEQNLEQILGYPLNNLEFRNHSIKIISEELG